MTNTTFPFQEWEPTPRKGPLESLPFEHNMPTYKRCIAEAPNDPSAQLNADGTSDPTLLEVRQALWALAADLDKAAHHIAELRQRLGVITGTPRWFDPTAPRIEDKANHDANPI